MSFVATFLALVGPHLPGLLTKAAEAVVDEGAKRTVFEAVPNGVKAVWAKVWPKVEADPDAKSAAAKVAIDPENAKRLTALEVAIEDLLTNLAQSEPEWIAELQELMEYGDSTAAATVVNIDVEGDGNQVTGINSGKTVQMGDVAGDVNF